MCVKLGKTSDEIENCLCHEGEDLKEREAGKIGRTGRVDIGRVGRHARGIGRKAESHQVRHVRQNCVAYTFHVEVYSDIAGWMFERTCEKWRPREREKLIRMQEKTEKRRQLNSMES